MFHCTLDYLLALTYKIHDLYKLYHFAGILSATSQTLAIITFILIKVYVTRIESCDLSQHDIFTSCWVLPILNTDGSRRNSNCQGQRFHITKSLGELLFGFTKASVFN